MAVADRWHTKKPTLYWVETREPVLCREHSLPASADHGQGDRWQVRWRDESGKQGSRNFARKDGKNPEIHADAYDKQIQGQLQAGTYIDPAAGQILLEDFAKQWRASLSRDPATLETIDRHLAHIYDVEPGPRSRRAEGKSSIGRRSMAQLSKSPHAIQEWVKSLENKKLSANYIRAIVDDLSAIFNAAIDNGIVVRNPTQARSVSLPKVIKKKVVPWTLDMVAEGASTLDLRCKGGCVVWLGCGAGLREAEIFGLAEEDIMFLGARMIRVRRQVKRIEGQLVFAPPKGGKEREVPLSNALSLQLAAQIKARTPVEVALPWLTPDSKKLVTAKLLLVKRDGQPYYRQAFEHHWTAVKKAVGVAGLREQGLHVMRHTFASACLSGGVDIRTLAEWLGHDDPGFTLKYYAHLMPDASTRGRKALDAFFSPAEGEASAQNVPSAGKT